jgi:hypothetical protein
MIRFILNFILFGILFYLIYHFFPDAFQILVTWAEHLYEFLKDLAMQLYSKLSSVVKQAPSAPAAPAAPQHEALSWMVKSFYGR